ncbi:hypothetical protein Scani_05870 [Streptomyces caniferus]|uniref:Uncharacterized protein n=1 Tax=Streptomyces caniferus TaxID=285557 RepID=A0A640RZH5_9ACTN|nr:hypothetical protein Scani_05870 [Streptomyces caniferus]
MAAAGSVGVGLAAVTSVIVGTAALDRRPAVLAAVEPGPAVLAAIEPGPAVLAVFGSVSVALTAARSARSVTGCLGAPGAAGSAAGLPPAGGFRSVGGAPEGALRDRSAVRASSPALRPACMAFMRYHLRHRL